MQVLLVSTGAFRSDASCASCLLRDCCCSACQQRVHCHEAGRAACAAAYLGSSASSRSVAEGMWCAPERRMEATQAASTPSSASSRRPCRARAGGEGGGSFSVAQELERIPHTDAHTRRRASSRTIRVRVAAAGGTTCRPRGTLP